MTGSRFVGYVYNLNSLFMKTGAYTASDGIHDYAINICGALATDASPCPGSHGACQSKNGGQNPYAMGFPSTNLTALDGIITLEYQGGDVCHDQYMRTTQISFVCGGKRLAFRKPLFFSPWPATAQLPPLL